MTLIDWIPPLTTTSILAAVGWLFRGLISNRLTKSVQFEFDKKMEALRSDFRKSEEGLKAQLKEREAELGALRSGALTTLASRQAALDKRRLEAVDQLWGTVQALGALKMIAAQMAIIKFEAVAKETQRNPQARQLFEAMAGGVDLKAIDFSGAGKARPFTTPMVWALYSAFQAILCHAAVRWKVITSGIGPGDFVDDKGVEQLILAVLPHMAEHFAKHGPSSYYSALDALELRLLESLQDMLSGKEIDRAGLDQAAEIIRLANAVQSKDNL